MNAYTKNVFSKKNRWNDDNKEKDY